MGKAQPNIVISFIDHASVCVSDWLIVEIPFIVEGEFFTVDLLDKLDADYKSFVYKTFIERMGRDAKKFFSDYDLNEWKRNPKKVKKALVELKEHLGVKAKEQTIDLMSRLFAYGEKEKKLYCRAVAVLPRLMRTLSVTCRPGTGYIISKFDIELSPKTPLYEHYLDAIKKINCRN